jgi:hypothetical protein
MISMVKPSSRLRALGHSCRTQLCARGTLVPPVLRGLTQVELLRAPGDFHPLSGLIRCEVAEVPGACLCLREAHSGPSELGQIARVGSLMKCGVILSQRKTRMCILQNDREGERTGGRKNASRADLLDNASTGSLSVIPVICRRP